MKPYYEHAGITIYHGDCREVLPHLSGYDGVVTDPVWANASPYLVGAYRPFELLAESAALWDCKRAAVHLGCNSETPSADPGRHSRRLRNPAAAPLA